VRASVALALAFAAAASAHEIITTKLTWNREISRIIYRRCVSCHREGGTAPMALITYAESRPWAKAIKEEILERRMPPWGAVKGFGDFQDDVSLTQEEIALIADWVEGGAPEGEAGYEPYKPSPQVPPKPTLFGGGLVVRGEATLKAPASVRAIQPDRIADGASFQVIAQLPDGRVEPMLWILGFKEKWRRAYAYRAPVRLPAGSKIAVFPPEAGTVRLIR
jgi:mono/diheme cytochrome c family protein